MSTKFITFEKAGGDFVSLNTGLITKMQEARVVIGLKLTNVVEVRLLNSRETLYLAGDLESIEKRINES